MPGAAPIQIVSLPRGVTVQPEANGVRLGFGSRKRWSCANLTLLGVALFFIAIGVAMVASQGLLNSAGALLLVGLVLLFLAIRAMSAREEWRVGRNNLSIHISQLAGKERVDSYTDAALKIEKTHYESTSSFELVVAAGERTRQLANASSDWFDWRDLHLLGTYLSRQTGWPLHLHQDIKILLEDDPA